MNLYDVIRRPLDTEKVERNRERFNQYAFEVDRRATKLEVRQAVETLFKVQVEGVTTQILRGKPRRVGLSLGRRPNWKRAIVTLKEGESISLFEAK